jgi:hypothetical protein
MTTQIEWPELPEISAGDPQAAAKLELYKTKLAIINTEHQAKVDREKAEYQANVNRESAEFANQYATTQEVYKGYVEVAKGQIDRSLQRADFVQKVAAAIGTVYTGIIAFSFAVAKDAVIPLPVTGMGPAIFLGLSLVLASAYVAYLGKPSGVKPEPSGGTLRSDQVSQRNTFIKWNRASVLQNRYFLEASVVSLGIGVASLPLPYLERKATVLWWLVGIGVFLTFLIPLLVERFQHEKESDDTTPVVPTVSTEEE